MDLTLYKAKPNKSIREHTDDLLNNLKYLVELGYLNDKRVIELTYKACEYHDFGKANREFQYRIKNQTKFNENKEIAHNVLSVYFINPKKFEKQDYYRICFAVLFHHYYCDCISILEDIKSKAIIENLLSDFTEEIYPIKRATVNNINKIKDDKNAILIKGLVNKCDFSASGETVIEYENSFLNIDLEKLLKNWKNKNSKAKWNELQKFCKNNSNENIIVVAQTGMGKTEAGLHWIGNNKGFFILPLKTAINAIYERISNSIVQDEIEHKVALIHSDTLSYYTSHSKAEIDILTYQRDGKQLSIPLNITTLDQIFDFVIKCKGYEMKLATLSYSKLVIDEIQMYSADLLAYLISGIKTIIEFGGKVAILTATLAPFIRDLLLEGNNKLNFKTDVFINDLKRHNIKVYDFQIDSNIIYEKYIMNKEKGISNKILVVCNTIKKAQEIYSELLKKIDCSNVNIFHSKFIKKERSAKEREILKFGETENIDSGIWISTQIVEASLDIDFDYLFTELSDINGLFQRLGRCNRKGIKSVEEYNCYVFLKIEDKILTNGDKGFIDRKIYELSRDAIKNIDGILSEDKKIEIIENTLTTQNIKGSKYWEEYRKFSRWIEEVEPYEIDKKDAKLRNIVSFDIIPKIVYEKNRKIIDDQMELLKKDIDILQRVKLIDKIKSFTVSVGKYDLDILGNKALYCQLEINDFIKFPVINCQYDDKGFIRKKKEGEEIFDNFI